MMVFLLVDQYQHDLGNLDSSSALAGDGRNEGIKEKQNKSGVPVG
jgi:hypothetical protein